MDEYGKSSEKKSEEMPEKIDITGIVQNVFQAIKKLWWILIILIVLFAVKEYFSVSFLYTPKYTASATVSVSSGTGSSAEDIANLFPYMMENGVLDEVISEDLGIESVTENISVTADKGTSFLTISVSSEDPQMAYDLLMSVIENYPDVAEFVFGDVNFIILDETGVPSDDGKEERIRGSYKKGALKGAIAGMIVVLIYALSRTTVKSKQQLKERLNLMECGCIPHIREKKRRKRKFNSSLNLLNERVPQSYVEAIRKIRIKLVREMEEQGAKSLIVTSTVPGEGKTSIAVNLAIAIAQQGKNVILIDCDLRNPSVAGVIGIDTEFHGLAEVLDKKVKIEEALVPVNLTAGSLKVLFSREEKENNAKILKSRRMGQLIQYCKNKADIVILDTAPSGLLADAPILAKYVDSAVYVIRHDYTKMRHIREGVQALAMSGIKILGYIYNDDSSGKEGYGYGYNYGYKRYGGYMRYGRGGHYDTADRRLSERNGMTDKYGRVYKD